MWILVSVAIFALLASALLAPTLAASQVRAVRRRSRSGRRWI
jgi:hypothetical protein